MNEPNHVPPPEETGFRPPPGLSGWGRFWFWLKFWLYVKTARLRFIVVLVAVGGLIASWDTLKAYYEKWTRPAASEAQAAADTEFFCPMHPQIIDDKPSKCPLCGMPLSKRKTSAAPKAEALPAGVVSRVQLSPYRIALAGIQTSEVGYRPLIRDIRTVGFVEFDETRVARVSVRFGPNRSRIDELKVITGAEVKKGDPLAVVYSPDLIVTVETLLDSHKRSDKAGERSARDRLERWGIESEQIDEILHSGQSVTKLEIRSPISGHVIRKYQWQGEYVDEGARLYDIADLSNVWVEAQVYEEDLPYLKENMGIVATTAAFPNREFTGRIAFIQPHLDASTRTLRVRFNMENPSPHELRPGMYASVKLQVAVTEAPAFRRTLAAELATRNLLDPASVLYVAGSWARLAQGVALAVPDSAVIDTGARKIVYRQSEPGAFDGVEVQLGPRCENYYPVLSGLQAGDVVATAGSFLIDAETRLNPSVGSTYFGAGGTAGEHKHAAASVRPSMVDDESAKIEASLAKLAPADRLLARQQEFCVIQQNSRLGSMGTPLKLELKNQTVFVCCQGCVDEARGYADRSVARARELRAKNETKR